MDTASFSNFAHLEHHQPRLMQLGMLAERYFADDPNTSLLKLRQMAEAMTQLTASQSGLLVQPGESQYELLRRLRDAGVISPEMFKLFEQVRRSGNKANHALTDGHQTALGCLKIARGLSVWYYRTFADPNFIPGPFIPPTLPTGPNGDLSQEIERLRQELQAHQSSHQTAVQQLGSVMQELQSARNEKELLAKLNQDTETAKAQLEAQLAQLQAQALTKTQESLNLVVQASSRASESLELDEATTRQLIDDQLRTAGWEADSHQLRYSKGTRPQKGRNLAIAEWPTASGPADYVLFVGLIPVATVEAKRKNRDVSAYLQQAKRYSRDFNPSSETVLGGGDWGEFQVPFAFSTNGREYLRQLPAQSGIWFCDLRRPTNLSRALMGWHSPQGLLELMEQDAVASHQKLEAASFNYGFRVRDYQQSAIRAVEGGIAEGRREMLLAMATGTGKTKTCIALIYRLLSAQRFRRVLFLVDRSALGEQAANAFKDTRMENLQAFADIFGIKELEDAAPDDDTAVHLATVQGMVRRVLYPAQDQAPPPVDQYDCIVVDECHRGYLLDRELSDTELGFRDFDDYVSKYRRVLDYFDAVKVGLTATPALHTTQIFGEPIYTYSYREAVIDGHLIDHEPPIQIQTELSSTGISWNKGDEVKLYDPKAQTIQLATAPDQINLEVESFNRRVITEAFNRVVCDHLAEELDPNSSQKTLIFCANDAHADLVVDLLKQAFERRYGSVDDDSVVKITGSADKPLQLIRRYKNERMPSVAVTVDLLTTGVDVPEICNLVFLRRVNSRILFDQMLGRATRPCDAVGKEAFRIFDAVQIYEALKDVTAMQPVVVNPEVSFAQLERELSKVQTDPERALVREQLLAKLQRKKRSLGKQAAQNFETVAGMTLEAFIQKLRQMPLGELGAWPLQTPGWGEMLDQKGESGPKLVFISEHPDQLLSVERGYGKATRPQDYLDAFSEFVRSNSDRIPALLTVLTRPRELTRKQLRELALELDRAGFSETNLATAWREMTNQDIAARIVGYIRQAALNDPLLPYEQRVDRALQEVLASKAWTTPQRQWLQKIAAQTKANLVVDLEALDDPDLIFKREGGGFGRLDKLFGGELITVLERFNESIWQPKAA